MKKSFLEKGRWAKPAITLTPAESPTLRALRRRRADRTNPHAMNARKCCICGARVLNHNPSPKIDTCDHVCREAKAHGISRADQLQLEADSHPWPETPFEVLANGIARRSCTLASVAS